MNKAISELHVGNCLIVQTKGIYYWFYVVDIRTSLSFLIIFKSFNLHQ